MTGSGLGLKPGLGLGLGLGIGLGMVFGWIWFSIRVTALLGMELGLIVEKLGTRVQI